MPPCGADFPYPAISKSSRRSLDVAFGQMPNGTVVLADPAEIGGRILDRLEGGTFLRCQHPVVQRRRFVEEATQVFRDRSIGDPPEGDQLVRTSAKRPRRVAFLGETCNESCAFGNERIAVTSELLWVRRLPGYQLGCEMNRHGDSGIQGRLLPARRRPPPVSG